MQNKREVTFDLLRIICAFCIVTIHICAMEWDKLIAPSLSYSVTNIYESLSRWGIPGFIMLSGAFLLSKDKGFDIKTFYKKYILRIVVILLIWGTLYGVLLKFEELGTFDFNNVYTSLIDVLTGNAQDRLWFLYMILGLYIVTPIIKVFVNNAKKQEILYYLTLVFILNITIPYLMQFNILNNISMLIYKLHIDIVLGYVGYYVAGYYIKNFTISKKESILIYILGIIGLLFTVIASQIQSIKVGYGYQPFYGYLSPNVALTTIAVFLLFKNCVSKIKFSDKLTKIITTISSCTLGIYLVHTIFNQLFIMLDIVPSKFNEIIAVPLITTIIFVLSFGVIWIIKKIPVVSKLVI